MKTKIIFTCEHAFYSSPPYLGSKKHFPSSLLKSHYGWDAGAKKTAELLGERTEGKVFLFPWSRLYIDANRRLDNRAIHPKNQETFENKWDLLVKDYQTYRNKVIKQIDQHLKNGNKVKVFSIHSFTPNFKGKRRKTDIGILFRPQIKKEVALANSLKSLLKKDLSHLGIHFNRPYRGHTDCFLNDVLDNYKTNHHVNGLFMEINQSLMVRKKDHQSFIRVFSDFINL